MAIEWIKEEDFRKRFEMEYRPQKKFILPSLGSQTSFAELCKILPVPLSSNLNEDDGLGERNCWFGVLEDLLFTITCYCGLPDGLTLDFPERDELSEKYHWSFLEKIVDLPNPILNRITWIRDFRSVLYGKAEERAEKSVYFKDKHSIVWGVYSALGEKEAIELFNFLQTLKPEFEYWIDESEDIDSTWIAVRHFPDEEDRIVAKYPGRSTTENAAQWMSLRDKAFYQAKEEKSNKLGLAFRNGIESDK